MAKTQIIIISALTVAIVIVCPVLAEEMSSTNYKIQADSVNVGGILATTTNYQLQNTIGESVTGVSDSANYKVKAGYQQMHEVYISVTAPANITMAPNIKTISGGASNGSGNATVITDSASGYILSIKASAAPAMAMAGDSFADYTPAAAGTPDYTWLVAVAGSEFGFTPEGAHIMQKFKDNGAVCNAGAGDTASACWYNLSTINETIAQSYSANHTAGTATTLRFKAESGSSHTQTIGNYQATITLTALAN